ncbi:MAG: helix-turn-helix transcriptional regulator [Lachnospiraceae bacterium]|jgi:putative transcriptional regulator|nr:helix-turn-helix transcriptional regulator [Lachnospiraceae bacterium]
MRNRIRSLRKESGLRQEDLAKALGVSRQTIIAVENDKYNPTLELALKMARLLQVPVEELFFLDEQLFYEPAQQKRNRCKQG